MEEVAISEFKAKCLALLEQVRRAMEFCPLVPLTSFRTRFKMSVKERGGVLTSGSYAMAYACESGSLTSSLCTDGNIYATPFTHAGDATGASEAGTPLLLGVAFLFGLAAFGRRGTFRTVE